jgi:uncharacterized protein (TIGR00266 family)
MRIETKFAPASTIAICHLEPEEVLQSESGAFMAMKGQVLFETTTRQKSGGGFFKGLKRLVSGESFFINRYTAKSAAQVYLGTALPGDIFVKQLNGEKLIIQGGSYVASEPKVEIDLEWQGLKSIFSGESLFWVKAKGHGQVILNSFGFVYPVQVDGEYIVDTGHIVAFEETLNFSISKASDSWLQAFLSGEGFICRFKGRGTVWCQSHSPRGFGKELRPYLKTKKG